MERARAAVQAIAGSRPFDETVPAMLRRVARETGLPLARITGYWHRKIERVPYEEGMRLFAAGARAPAASPAEPPLQAEEIAVAADPDLAIVAAAYERHRHRRAGALDSVLSTALRDGERAISRALGLKLVPGDIIRTFAGARCGAINHRSMVNRSVREPPCADAAEALIRQARQGIRTGRPIAFRIHGTVAGKPLGWTALQIPDPAYPDQCWRFVADVRGAA